MSLIFILCSILVFISWFDFVVKLYELWFD